MPVLAPTRRAIVTVSRAVWVVHQTDTSSSPAGIRNRTVSTTWMKSSRTNRRGSPGMPDRCFCMSTTDVGSCERATWAGQKRRLNPTASERRRSSASSTRRVAGEVRGQRLVHQDGDPCQEESLDELDVCGCGGVHERGVEGAVEEILEPGGAPRDAVLAGDIGQPAGVAGHQRELDVVPRPGPGGTPSARCRRARPRPHAAAWSCRRDYPGAAPHHATDREVIGQHDEIGRGPRRKAGRRLQGAQGVEGPGVRP